MAAFVCAHLSSALTHLKIASMWLGESLQGLPVKEQLNPPEFHLCMFESSSDLHYCASPSQHRHLLAGKRWFLLHKMALVHGKKCWTIIEPNVVFITTLANTCFPRSPLLEGYVLKKTLYSLQAPKNLWKHHMTLMLHNRSTHSPKHSHLISNVCVCVLVDCFHLFVIFHFSSWWLYKTLWDYKWDQRQNK